MITEPAENTQYITQLLCINCGHREEPGWTPNPVIFAYGRGYPKGYRP